MKRCPECRRDYVDDNLLYCLEDGSSLVQGAVPLPDEPQTAILSEPLAAAGGTLDEPGTAILHSTAAPGEAPTRAQIHTTEQTAVLPKLTESPITISFSRKKSLIVAALGITLVAVLGIGSYLYFGRGSAKQIESIAVMPFVNESGNAENEYLSDGMTETLMNSLSQLPNLNVQARSSVFRYKGRDADAKTIGKELNVQAVLNGRVVQHGDDLVLYLELVDAQTGKRVWGDQYNRKQTDLATLQSEIAHDVSNKLKTKLSASDVAKVEKRNTANPEAYRLYLQGRYFWNKRTPDDFIKANTYFQQALALDPEYALAYSGLSDSLGLISIYGGGSPEEYMPQAKAAALKALSLDNDLAEAHASLAEVLRDYEYDFSGAEKEYRRAIELDPNYANAHQWLGEELAMLGKFDESAAEFDRALEIDPLSLPINRMRALTLYHAKKYDESIAGSKKVLEMDPNFAGPHNDLFVAYKAKGEYGLAVDEFAKLQEKRGNPQKASLARDSYAKGGWQGFLLAMARRDGPVPDSGHFAMAGWQVALGNNERAIDELQFAYEHRNPGVQFLKVDPRFDPLRKDPRFQQLLQKMGFPN